MEWDIELHDEVDRWFVALCEDDPVTAFAFDPVRRAVLLVAGDKAGNWKRWYDVTIPIAEERYRDHLRTGEEG